MSNVGVLVTGATGNVGRCVVTELRARGTSVKAATRPGSAALGAEGAVVFDFTLPETWGPALDGVDRLFLMRPPLLTDTRTEIRPFLERAAQHGLDHVALLSVMGVNPMLPHWQIEQDLKRLGLSYTSLRPSYFMQNLTGPYLADIRDRDRIRLPAGRGRTSFVDTRDIGAAAAAVLADPSAHAGKAYALTGSRALTWDEVASILTAELGRPIHYESPGVRTYRRELRAAGGDRTYVRVHTMINVIARVGLAAKVTDDVPQLLGREPTTVERFVHEHRFAWLA